MANEQHGCEGRLKGDARCPGRRCTKKTKVVRKGKVYCLTHDPVRVEKKREARDAAWREKRERKDAVAEAADKRRKLEEKFCARVETEDLKRIVERGDDLLSWMGWRAGKPKQGGKP